MRHGAGSLLPGPERLEGLTNFRALEVPQLDRHPLEGPSQDGERGQELSVAVAADHLGRRWVRVESEAVEDVALDRGADVRVRADRPADRPDADHLAGAGEALDVAQQLGVPAGGLEAERDRLGMNAMAAPDHRRVAMLEREAPHHLG